MEATELDAYWLAASIACGPKDEAQRATIPLAERLAAYEGHVRVVPIPSTDAPNWPHVVGLLYRRTSPMLSAVLETLVHVHRQAPELRYLLHLREPKSGAMVALLIDTGRAWDALAAASMPWRQCLRAAFGDAWRDALLGVPVPTFEPEHPVVFHPPSDPKTPEQLTAMLRTILEQKATDQEEHVMVEAIDHAFRDLGIEPNLVWTAAHQQRAERDDFAHMVCINGLCGRAPQWKCQRCAFVAYCDPCYRNVVQPSAVARRCPIRACRELPGLPETTFDDLLA